MKKFMFSLMALGMFSVVSASTGKIEKELVKIKKEETKETSKTPKTIKKEETIEVYCSAWIRGRFYENYYSCFFCWGGSARGCKAELLDQITD